MNKELSSKLNPLSKLRIYEELKKLVFKKMEAGIMLPSKSNEILDYLKNNLVSVKTALQAKQFLDDLVLKYSELTCVKQNFDMITGEKIHKVFLILIDSIMNKGDFDLAEEVMAQIQSLESDWDEDIFESIKDVFPNELDSSIEQVIDDLKH